jgi:hypothetical protein
LLVSEGQSNEAARTLIEGLGRLPVHDELVLVYCRCADLLHSLGRISEAIQLLHHGILQLGLMPSVRKVEEKLIQLSARAPLDALAAVTAKDASPLLGLGLGP